MKYKVVETFISINGEGKKAGELALFIRLAGCNLACKYCDTMWANDENVSFKLMSIMEIDRLIKESQIRNVTITGGEPLMSNNFYDLLNYISDNKNINIEIETNGSYNIEKYKALNKKNISFTLDYKSNSSGMEDKMFIDNFKFVDNTDVVKFVVGTLDDLITAKELIKKYNLSSKTNVFFSPIFGEIETNNIVEFMKKNNLIDIKLQLQLHKYIWDPEKIGV